MSGQNKPAQGLRCGLIGNDASKTNRLAHIRGEVRSEATQLLNADKPGPPDVVELAVPMTADELARHGKERKRYLRGRRGRPPKEIAELILWGPPRHAAKNAWSREQSKEWADDSLAWCRRHFPDSPVVAASLHMDEGSPHCHVALYPRYQDMEGVMAYGWKRAHSAAANRLAGEATQLNDAPQRIRSQKCAGHAMSVLLDDYYATVGEKDGLARGQKGSQRGHKAVEVDEASRRHAADRSMKLDVRERAVEELEAQRVKELDEAHDLADELMTETVTEINQRQTAMLERERKSKRKVAEVEELARKKLAQADAREKKAMSLETAAQYTLDEAHGQALRIGASQLEDRRKRQQAEAELARYKRKEAAEAEREAEEQAAYLEQAQRQRERREQAPISILPFRRRRKQTKQRDR